MTPRLERTLVRAAKGLAAAVIPAALAYLVQFLQDPELTASLPAWAVPIILAGTPVLLALQKYAGWHDGAPAS